MDKETKFDVSTNFVKLGLAVASLVYPTAGVVSATIDTATSVVKAIANVQSAENDIVTVQLKSCISAVIQQMKSQLQNNTQKELLEKYALPRYAWWHDQSSAERMSIPDIEMIVSSWFDNQEAHREMYLSLQDIKEINQIFAAAFQKELPNYPNLLAWLNYDNAAFFTDQVSNWMDSIDARLRALEKPEDPFLQMLSQNGLHKSLWHASRRAYMLSKSEGNRFSYDIIEKLLPQGYLPKFSAPIEGRNEAGQSVPLADLCRDADRHVAIIGNGGIGKTTFLQTLMDKVFAESEEYSTDIQIPFFIELNRCPADIRNWYDDSLHKTNFITRYIACLLENHLSLHDTRHDTLSKIEKAFQYAPHDGNAQYLLLLDGFNEVKIDEDYSVRRLLSEEISVMKEYPNIRIITTSRETQAAYYAHDFKNIRVSGLEDDVIIEYLKSCGRVESALADIRRCERLMDCLRIPLYLCMFASSSDSTLLPETHGEILYYFFHKNSSFYNLRKRAHDARNNPLSAPQTKVVLDFILPYIGYHLESNDIFSVNTELLEKLICEAVINTEHLFAKCKYNPFIDYNYQQRDLLSALNSLIRENEPDVLSITKCIYDYLGIIYQFHGNSKDYSQRMRYAFSHHSFRDYFSAMWSIQLLRMLPSTVPTQFNALSDATAISYHTYLNSSHWSIEHVSLISEILMEHRNKPIVDHLSKNWITPAPLDEMQTVLNSVLDYSRELSIDIHYLITNILSAIYHGRKEYTTLDLSELDLSHVSLHNVICSRKGHSRIEGTNFSHSIISEKCLQPETHQDNIIEYLYLGQKCLTLDFSGQIKSWDIKSGKLEYELFSISPSGIGDHSSKGYMKCSQNSTYLGVKSQESTASGMSIKLLVFNMAAPQKPPLQIIPEPSCRTLSYFAFSDDEKSLVLICDEKKVFFYDLAGTLLYHAVLDGAFHKQNEVYFPSTTSEAYIFSNNYKPFDDYDEEYDEDEELHVICDIHRLDFHTMQIAHLHTFFGTPATAPAAAYIPGHNGFLVYEDDEQQITFFDCKSQRTKAMFLQITHEHSEEPPAAFHAYAGNSSLCYIMYVDTCYLVDIVSETRGRNGILKTYRAEAIQRKLYEIGFKTELLFYVNVRPSEDTFLLFDDNGKTYEWNSETDIIRPKYNGLLYDTAYLTANPERTKAYLVHSDNGISQFGGSPLALQYHHCYQNQGYSVSCADSDFIHNRLALAFADLGHEKVVLVDLETYEEITVFSTWEKFETITDLCFHDDGTKLLITTQYKCVEILLDTHHVYTVAVAENNERFGYGGYSGNSIEIAVIEADDSSAGSRCEYYERQESYNDILYLKTWYYLIPELPKELFSYFVYANGDFGKEGPHNQDGIQKYWLTKGFFLENRPEFESVLHPECYIRDGNSFIRSDNSFDRLNLICVRHEHALARSIGTERRWTYMLFDPLQNEAILTEKQSRLAWCKDIESMTYRKVEEMFERRIGNSVEYAVWGHVVPWNNNKMMGCFELTNIQLIDQDTAEESELVDYEPGYCISGCDFTGVLADADTIEKIKSCGGNISP